METSLVLTRFYLAAVEKAWYHYYVADWTQLVHSVDLVSQYAASTSNRACIDGFCQQLRTLQVPSRYLTMCRHKWKALYVRVCQLKGSGKAEGKRIAPCQNKCLHSGYTIIKKAQSQLEPLR